MVTVSLMSTLAQCPIFNLAQNYNIGIAWFG